MRWKRRERQREGESEGISRGIKPKPQDISDLEGKWVKQGGWGGRWGRGQGGRAGERERERMKKNEEERKSEGKEQRDGEREKQSLQRAAGKPPESSAQTNHKIPTKATKPVRGPTGVPSARNDVCAAAIVCACGLHTFTFCAICD